MAWKQLSRRVVKDLMLNRLYLYSLDAGTLVVRYENGVMETKRLVFRDCAPRGLSQRPLCDRLTEMVHQWARLPPTAMVFHERMCHNLNYCGIDELVLTLTITHYYKRAKSSSRPDALPFQLEYEDAKMPRGTARDIILIFKM